MLAWFVRRQPVDGLWHRHCIQVMQHPVDDLSVALQEGRVYFGLHHRAFQGAPTRFAYMLAAMRLLTKSRRAPMRVLEVGTWAGGSALTWAEGIHRFNGGSGTVLCVDTWRPYAQVERYDAGNPARPILENMEAAAKSGEILRLFEHNLRCSPYGNCVSYVRGASRDVLPVLADRTFDLVYIDGSHVYSEARFDLEQGIRLTAEAGIICGDDLELQSYEVDRGELLRDSDLEYAKTSAGAYYHPGVTQAVGELLGRVSQWEGFFAMRRCKQAFESIEMSSTELSLPGHLRAWISAPPRLVGSANGYNLVFYDGRYWGIPQTFGPFDLTDPANRDKPGLHVAQTMAELEHRVSSLSLKS
jgi:predicted O-methyltransferase YrrM